MKELKKSIIILSPTLCSNREKLCKSVMTATTTTTDPHYILLFLPYCPEWVKLYQWHSCHALDSFLKKGRVFTTSVHNHFNCSFHLLICVRGSEQTTHFCLDFLCPWRFLLLTVLLETSGGLFCFLVCLFFTAFQQTCFLNLSVSVCFYINLGWCISFLNYSDQKWTW